jgi:DNA-binding response OmpR family regulator
LWKIPVESPRTTILIAVSDPDQSRSISHLLESVGYRVIAARDGASTLRLVKEDPPDLVIHDPGMSGVAVGSTIMAVANHGDSRSHFDVVEIEFLKIPFDPEMLLERIRSLIASGRCPQSLSNPL